MLVLALDRDRLVDGLDLGFLFEPQKHLQRYTRTPQEL